MKRATISLTIISTSLICAYLATTELAGPWLHIFTNIFAGGRSSTKTIGFFLFLALCFTIYYIGPYPRLPKLASLNKILTSGVVALFLLGLCGHVYIISHAHGNIFADYIFFNQQEISSSSVQHNHVLKGAIGLALSKTTLAWQENIDIGTPFLPLLPSPFFISALLGIIFVTACTLLTTVRLANKTVAGAWFTMLCWSITSFVVIKNIIDGGLFNSEALVTLTFWIVLLYEKTNNLITLLLRAIFVSLCISCVLLLAHKSEAHIEVLLHTISQTVSLGLLYICATLWSHKLMYPRLRGLVLIFTVLTLVPATWRDFAIIEYDKTVIAAQDKVYASGFTSLGPTFSKLNQIGDLGVYSHTAASSTTIENIINEHHLLDNYYPLLLEWQHYFPTGEPHIYSFTLITNLAPPSNWSSGSVHIYTTPLQHTNTRYAVSARIPQCFPRPLNIMHQALRETGQDVFRITDLQNNF